LIAVFCFYELNSLLARANYITPNPNSYRVATYENFIP
jgi:hypothetical protein